MNHPLEGLIIGQLLFTLYTKGLLRYFKKIMQNKDTAYTIWE